MVRYFNGKGKYLREGNRRYEEGMSKKGKVTEGKKRMLKKKDLEGKVG